MFPLPQISEKSDQSVALQKQIQAQLKEYFGDTYEDNSLTLYVFALIQHVTTQQDLQVQLVEFLGQEDSKVFTEWLVDHIGKNLQNYFSPEAVKKIIAAHPEYNFGNSEQQQQQQLHQQEQQQRQQQSQQSSKQREPIVWSGVGTTQAENDGKQNQDLRGEKEVRGYSSRDGGRSGDGDRDRDRDKDRDRGRDRGLKRDRRDDRESEQERERETEYQKRMRERERERQLEREWLRGGRSRDSRSSNDRNSRDRNGKRIDDRRDLIREDNRESRLRRVRSEVRRSENSCRRSRSRSHSRDADLKRARTSRSRSRTPQKRLLQSAIRNLGTQNRSPKDTAKQSVFDRLDYSDREKNQPRAPEQNPPAKVARSEPPQNGAPAQQDNVDQQNAKSEQEEEEHKMEAIHYAKQHVNTDEQKDGGPMQGRRVSGINETFFHVNLNKAPDTRYVHVSQMEGQQQQQTQDQAHSDPTEFQDIESMQEKLRIMEIEMNQLREKQRQVVSQFKDTSSFPTPTPNSNPTPNPSEVEYRSVVVKNVHFAATEEVLAAHFNNCGPIVSINIARSAHGPKGYAYIEFGHEMAAANAQQLSNSLLLQRAITVVPKLSSIPPPSSNSGFPSQPPKGRGYPPPWLMHYGGGFNAYAGGRGGLGRAKPLRNFKYVRPLSDATETKQNESAPTKEEHVDESNPEEEAAAAAAATTAAVVEKQAVAS